MQTLLMRSARCWHQHEASTAGRQRAGLQGCVCECVCVCVCGRGGTPCGEVPASENGILAVDPTSLIADLVESADGASADAVKCSLLACSAMHLWYGYTRRRSRIHYTIIAKFDPRARRTRLQVAWTLWLQEWDEQCLREQERKVRLDCLRQLRPSFGQSLHFPRLTMANALEPWAFFAANERMREGELNGRLGVLRARFALSRKSQCLRPWHVLAHRTRLLSLHSGRLSARLHLAFADRVFSSWRDALRRWRALEATSTRVLWRCLIVSFQSWARYAGSAECQRALISCSLASMKLKPHPLCFICTPVFGLNGSVCKCCTAETGHLDILSRT